MMPLENVMPGVSRNFYRGQSQAANFARFFRV
jgi:hypothetical protein